MALINEPEPIRAECIFGTQRLLPLLDAFSKEIDGVKKAEDREHIHRMRVTSRRLRAALPLFVSCIPEKKYRVWMQEIQRITRALGEARDTDVQIAFIIKLIKRREDGMHENDPSVSSPILLKGDLETILLSQLQKKRLKLQTVVISALEKLEKSGVIDDMRIFFTSQTVQVKSTRKKSSPYGIPAVAASRISRRLNALLSYERWVHNPDAIAEHHAMRISAKKLRYTMEVYAPLYRLGLKKPLFRVKKIQEILGDLHDCDVWINTVMVMLLKERSTFRTTSSSKNIQVCSVTGYKHFLSEREKERKRLYRQFVRYWDSLVRVRIWENLQRTLTDKRKKKFRVPVKFAVDEIRSSVSSLSGQFPEGLMHSRKVTSLALMMFDDLAPLHRMNEHERFLLECACSLHDIGLKYGQKGHAKRSADMILSDENLPIDIIDRGIIGMISNAHRGEIRFESKGIFSLLSSKERDYLLMLASLIRIADGLDYRHLGSVESVHCLIHPEEVVIVISAKREASAEMERALKKGDLFTQVFERKLVIR